MLALILSALRSPAMKERGEGLANLAIIMAPLVLVIALGVFALVVAQPE